MRYWDILLYIQRRKKKWKENGKNETKEKTKKNINKCNKFFYLWKMAVCSVFTCFFLFTDGDQQCHLRGSNFIQSHCHIKYFTFVVPFARVYFLTLIFFEKRIKPFMAENLFIFGCFFILWETKNLCNKFFKLFRFLSSFLLPNGMCFLINVSLLLCMVKSVNWDMCFVEYSVCFCSSAVGLMTCTLELFIETCKENCFERSEFFITSKIRYFQHCD